MASSQENTSDYEDSICSLYETYWPPNSSDRSSDPGSLDSLGEPYENCPLEDGYSPITCYRPVPSTNDLDNETHSTDNNEEDSDSMSSPPPPSPSDSAGNHNDTTNPDHSFNSAPSERSGSTEPGSCNCVPRCNDSQEETDEINLEELMSVVTTNNINDHNIYLEQMENRCTPLYTIKGISPLSPLQHNDQQLSELPPHIRRLGTETGLVDTGECPITSHHLTGNFNYQKRTLTDDELLQESTDQHLMFRYPFPLSPNDSVERSGSDWSDPNQDADPHAVYTGPPSSPGYNEYGLKAETDSDDSADTLPPITEPPYRKGTIVNGSWIEAMSQSPPPSLSRGGGETVTQSSDARPDVTPLEEADAREIVREYYDEVDRTMYDEEARDRDEADLRQRRRPDYITPNQIRHQLTSREEPPVAGPSNYKRKRSTEINSQPSESPDTKTTRLCYSDHSYAQKSTILQEFARASALAKQSMDQVRNRRLPGFERPPPLSPKTAHRQFTAIASAALEQLQQSFRTGQTTEQPLQTLRQANEDESLYIPTSDDELDETSARDDDDRGESFFNLDN